MQLFANDTPLTVDDYAKLEDLDLSAFPVVKDFRVCLQHGGNLGWHLRLVSSSRGMLAGFPWWDHADREIKKWSAQDLPTGSAKEPFDQKGEAWQVLIFEHEGVVYVLEGEDEGTAHFPRYFAVPQDRWESGWLRAAAACKAGKQKDIAV